MTSVNRLAILSGMTTNEPAEIEPDTCSNCDDEIDVNGECPTCDGECPDCRGPLEIGGWCAPCSEEEDG